MSIHGSTGATRSMQTALDLIAANRVHTDVLASHRYPLEEIQAAYEAAIGNDKGDYVKGVFAFGD
jgi:threonine dehydrogenase-like Zn-dependent dehydrogenase